jgi:hypothetical protein
MFRVRKGRCGALSIIGSEVCLLWTDSAIARPSKRNNLELVRFSGNEQVESRSGS